jgi:orotate phosphoribosyltransferase-like protein
MRMKYKISGFGNGVIAEGYTKIKIVDDIAEIDSTNADQVRLIKKHNGKPVVVVTAERKKGVKSSDSPTDL